MASYLRDWLIGGAVPLAPSVPTVELISPPASDDEDGEETETERDNDSPPAFPALNSVQRLKTSVPRVLTDSQLMPPPPVPSLSVRKPGVSLSSSRSSTSTSSTLAVPPSTTKAPVKKREKVALAPGHSPLDWAALKTSGQDLRVSITINLAVIMIYLNNSPFRELTICCVYLHQYSNNIISGMMLGPLSMEKYTISPPICHFIPEE